MAKFFISYSRVDRPFVDDFVPKVRRVYRQYSFWYDDDLRGGQDWWEQILAQIAACDVFIYLLSNESIQSEYCQREYQEALRLHKQILPIQIRARAQIPETLKRLHYVDMARGINNADARDDLHAAIQDILTRIPAEAPAPLSPEPMPLPHVEPPTLKRRAQPSGLVIGVMLVMLLGIASLLIWQFGMNGGSAGESNPTEIANADTPTPSILSEVEIEETVQAEMQQIFAEVQQTEQAAATNTAVRLTVDAQQTLYAQQTADAQATEIALSWTPTPTVDTRATAQARITETVVAATITQAWIDSWTPTPSNTPTNTPTPDATATLVAFRPQTNADWTPIEQDFDGVTMVLVPAGCFMMGSTSQSDEQPVHEQCFEAPFWIDKFEVTNEQYGSIGCSDRSSQPNQPRNCVSWFDARDFCAARDARLPTEAEWEYAARGVDGLTYPWGNEFVAANAVYSDNSSSQTANVGAGIRTAGASWVGAHDMSGNVWEWVSSLYEDYPYNYDTHESINDTNSRRVLRGGSWLSSSDVLRAANRNGGNPDIENFNSGFRCARS